MKNLNDKELIELYIKGENRAFEILYGRYRNFLFYCLNGFLGNDNSDIDDIFQQVWLKVIDNLPKYKDSDSFAAWIKLIARNSVIDRVRKNKRHGAVFSFNDEIYLDDIIDDNKSSQPWFELENFENDKILQDALDSLPAEQKRVYELRSQNLSFKEISKILDLSINTVLGQMNYAKKNLAKIVKSLYDK